MMEVYTKLHLGNHADIIHAEISKHTTVCSRFSNSRTSVSDVNGDVLLQCRDGLVPAHQAVLALVSPFLRRLMTDLSWEALMAGDSLPTLIFPDATTEDMSRLMEVLYTGRSVATESQLDNLMKLTRILKLRPIPVSVTKMEYSIPPPATVSSPLLIMSNRLVVKEEVSNKAVGIGTSLTDNTESYSIDTNKADNIYDDIDSPDIGDATQNGDTNHFATKHKEEIEEVKENDDENIVLVGTVAADGQISLTSEGSILNTSSSLQQESGNENAENISIGPGTNIMDNNGKVLITFTDDIQGYECHEEAQRTISEVPIIVENEDTPVDVSYEVTDEGAKMVGENDTEGIVFFCVLCSKKLFGNHAFKLHNRTSHPEGQGPFKCSVCDAVFSTGLRLNKHSEGCRSMKCLKCGEHFTDRRVYNSHMRKDHQVKYIRESYTCTEQQCNALIFSSFAKFRTHTITVHDKFPLVCEICGNRYKEKHSFHNHMAMHGGEAKYPCDVCSKKFITKERLFAHRKLHLGKRFVCQCGFKTRSTASLRTHIVMKHKERRFECNYCKKKFASKQNLQTHVRTHTGETPWECSLCDSKFNRLHHFRQHLQTSMHIKILNDLIASGQTIPDNLHPEKNISERKEIVDTQAVRALAAEGGVDNEEVGYSCEFCQGQVYKRDHHFQQHLKSRGHLDKLAKQESLGLSIPSHLIPPGVFESISEIKDHNEKIINEDDAEGVNEMDETDGAVMEEADIEAGENIMVEYSDVDTVELFLVESGEGKGYKGSEGHEKQLFLVEQRDEHDYKKEIEKQAVILFSSD